MAGTIGRITTALATVHNENSAALATLNFDFTLVKLEAPVEYSGLGATISRKRKTDAEEGSLHKTARRLGALFGELLPQTDDLFRAYGTRVSEISSIPSINPRESPDKAGIFGSHVGADTTSIWAAVTSGSAAIAVHLLGCMLARTFTSPEAISVWVELVQKQKQRIRNQQESQLYSQEHRAALSAAHQEIPRSDLANWDASARAWLQSADEAKAFQHKQTMLILNNASVPVNTESDTYSSVIKAWTVALEAMNNLVKGMPQRVQDGAALLAISSWHLYPDMIVYGGPCVEVKQKDPLFNQAALLTLGLQQIRDDSKSVYWSLPLACMQYYGHPVQASRTVGSENSRINYQQFAYIVLGCVFHGWNDHATSNDAGLQWVERLGAIFQSSTEQPSDRIIKPAWLIYLLATVRRLEACDESEKRAALQLMNLGRRRSNFLHFPNHIPMPLFGLSELETLLTVLKDDECRVMSLRKLCQHLYLGGSSFLIQYHATHPIHQSWPEYATVTSVGGTSQVENEKAKESGHLQGQFIRWIPISTYHLKRCIERSEEFEDHSLATERMKGLQEQLKCCEPMPARTVGDDPFSKATPWRISPYELIAQQIEDLRMVISISQRKSEIEQLGELCLPVVEQLMNPVEDDQRHHPGPRKHSLETSLIFGSGTNFLEASWDIMLKMEDPHFENAMSPTLYMGISKLASLVSIDSRYKQRMERSILTTEFLEGILVNKHVDLEKLGYHFSASNEIACLEACAMMADVYRLLPGATISTLVVKLPLYEAKWFPRAGRISKSDNDSQQIQPLSLSQAFACVAMFESGTCNADPDALSEVFAMSSGNSLYVAGALLCDPSEQPGPTEIRRVVGNIGRSGITFLISPPEVKIREPDPEKWMAINHNPFDGKLEDYFQKTSIHLSFTAYELPLFMEKTQRHIIDQDVTLVEALVSVYDGGSWVAEVDILKAFSLDVSRIDICQSHDSREKGHEKRTTYIEVIQQHPQLAATSIENWDELIEAPDSGVIAVRAHKNWVARLAAIAVCAKEEFITIVLPEEPCWKCCANEIPLGTNKGRIALIC
jgi:hypothetical protein